MNIFTIVEGSLNISYDNEVTHLLAKKDLSIVSNELYPTASNDVPRAVLFNLNRGYNELVFNAPLSSCSEDGINPFTVESFIIFAETYLGFYGNGGGGGTSGTSGVNGTSGTSGTGGGSGGTSGTSGTSGISGTGGVTPVPITKTNINLLIASNSLVAGVLYEISGVDKPLYNDGTTSGTTIYLQAITNNKLATQGYGIFYNPIYNRAASGFGLWNNKMDGVFSSIVGSFDYINRESVTTNNGAKGLILAEGLIQYVSGDWTTSVSITGDSSSATANIADFVTPTYNVNDKVIWGGYSWTNLNGNIGTSINVLNLDTTEWSKDVYDTINYNKVLDLIEYDIDNDWISRRHEIKSGNDVIFTTEDNNSLGLGFSAIAVFMFGNEYDSDLFSGIRNNIVYHAYNENINFYGTYQTDLTFESASYQKNLIFSTNSYQTNLAFGIASVQENLVFARETYQDTLVFVSYSNFAQSNIIFGIQAYQKFLTFEVNSGQVNIVLSSFSGQQNMNFESEGVQQNIVIPQFKIMKNINIESGTIIDNIDYSLATLVFESFPKTIYKRPDGVSKLRYYNNADTLVITNVND